MKNENITRTQIPIKIKGYRFDTTKEEENKKYKELCKNLKATGFKKDEVLDFQAPKDLIKKAREEPIKDYIETEVLFSNQFNTSLYRVWLWQEVLFPNKDIKSGYYLEFEPEDFILLSGLLSKRKKCGYCGNQTEAENKGICKECLSSEFLTEEELKKGFTRFYNINKEYGLIPLSEAELKPILPDFHKAQKETQLKKLDDRIKRAVAEAEEKVLSANTEKEAILYLIDKKLYDFIDNMIYYSHKNIFCFGWKDKLNFKQEQLLKDKLQNFPFNYEVKV